MGPEEEWDRQSRICVVAVGGQRMRIYKRGADTNRGQKGQKE